MGKSDATLDFKCKNSEIPETKEFQMLGISIDNKLKFDNLVAKICRKVSQQIAFLKRMKKMLPFETRRDLYIALSSLISIIAVKPGTFVPKVLQINWKG